MSVPRLIVFDLDFTLWDCGGVWCDCLSPPFRVRDRRIEDRTGRLVRLYDDVHDILTHCDEQAISIALASRTQQPDWARELLGHLDITHRFAFAEIYPSSKLRHFAALQQASGLAYKEMLFFDDEMRNIDEVGGLGVASIYVRDGMTAELFHASLNEFAER
ncbi:Acid Phosphatase [Bremerella volcania]|uniref:Acid Phosphatase n=1 Tax=Bremerella volcania TaxID=2527984 RepID=A0A518C2P4_9BACT|nr:magnesium-dependent phosphatase-1 [Bremerella volcania]QDU73444.1 Acid Phosphatase [Bremerella volcania]